MEASKLPNATDQSSQMVGILVNNVLLKAKVTLQQETIDKLSTDTSPEHPTSTSSVYISSSSSGVSLSSGSFESIAHGSPTSTTLHHTPPAITYQCQATQTDSPEAQRENHHDFLEQKLEAVTLSNELLSASLDGARRHISSLESTIASLNKELSGKDAQITTFSSRIATLLRSYESSQSDSLQYKHLYHRSVLQCNSRQSQIDQFQRLLPMLEQVNHLKVVAVAQLTENKELLVRWQTSLEGCQHKLKELESAKAKLSETTNECERLKKENVTLVRSYDAQERSLAHSISQLSVASALRKLHEEEIAELKIALKAQRTEVVSLKAKMVQVMDAFQRSREEYNENTEFTETERIMLMEANVDLEAQVETLKSSLEEKEKLLKDTKHEVQRTRNKAAEIARKLDERIKDANHLAVHRSKEVGELYSSLSPPLFELLRTLEQRLEEKPQTPPPVPSYIDMAHTKDHLSSLVTQLTSAINTFLAQIDSQPPPAVELSHGITPTCGNCSVLRSQLLEAVGILNGRSALQYGDMMQEKFSLETQVRELSTELEKGEKEFEKLSQYIKEYKTRTTEKVDILKSNMSKADNEIAELDRLLERTRQVLQENQPYLANCMPLLSLLHELEGGGEGGEEHMLTASLP